MSNLIFRTIHGSRLYGLEHEDSDYDFYEVYEGPGTDLKQSIGLHGDVVRGDLPAFIKRASEGSHQSCEALFSPVKKWAPGMEEKWGPYLEAFRVTGGEVFEKYERTIRKFAHGDLKWRKHAIRLWFNLGSLRMDGRFNPVLSGFSRQMMELAAERHEGDDLLGVLDGALEIATELAARLGR